MKSEGILFHAGINFLFAPPPLVSAQTSLTFQQAILAHGLEYNRIEYPKGGVSVVRETPSPLQILVSANEQQVGQLLIIAPKPNMHLGLFVDEAEAVVQAYEDNWPATPRAVVHVDASIRQLFETTSQHAFQELWEKRLGQHPESLGVFGRPIRGGGLRFVMDPIQEQLPAQIEVKIESFLQDTTKIFLETQFTWPIQIVSENPFTVRERIDQMSTYIQTHVIPFVCGENHDTQ